MQYVIDDVTLNLARKHAREAMLTISNGEFEVQATSRFLSWSKQNNNKKRIDVAIKPLKLGVVASPVAPHGLIGQTFDGDKTAIDGAIDDYSPSEVYTKAMGEGAIEGTAEEYEVRASDPFSDAFKYSRYHSLAASPRDTSKLAGVRRATGPFAPTGAAGINGDATMFGGQNVY